MKFLVSSSLLLKQLKVLGDVIGNNNTMPILDNFLFEITDSTLTITASDLETTMSASLEIESKTDGAIAIPAKLLLETIRTFPEQPLTFTKNEDLNIIEISSDYGKYALSYVDGEEFPKAEILKDQSEVIINSKILSTAISKTIFAVGNDDLRPVMSGVFISLTPEGITFVATDAHKLVKYNRTDIVSEKESGFIMPKKPLTLLKNTLSGADLDVKIEYNETNVIYTTDNIILVSRLIEGKYPNYEAVIPKVNPNVLTLDRVSFLNSVKRVSIFANKTTHQIKLSIKGSEVQISAEDIDYSNKADEKITGNYNGDDMQIGFNSKFLIEMLNSLESTDITLEMSAPNRAGILSPTDSLEDGEQILMLVMPVMVSA
ncbi:MAG: DNA polymerase III subunit beta [Ichthyobacteriaceae bacterium]|nr:DNA polymerase III subunit beta [Ichthyobacteriaceae bacterium]